jgi:alpha-1,3-rhamnosyl/mannosyltransferase
VGRADPYKNLATLIRAVAALRPQCPFPVVLDIVGPTDTRYPEAAALTRELGLAGAVRWRGYLDDAALVRAYQQAALVALPSLYEGFGLPVVEGMASGTPVVCSNVGALREIGGAAAVLVPPLDVAAWVEALRSVLTDPARAAELRARGLAHAAGFTWESTARQTLALYEEAAQ